MSEYCLGNPWIFLTRPSKVVKPMMHVMDEAGRAAKKKKITLNPNWFYKGKGTNNGLNGARKL